MTEMQKKISIEDCPTLLGRKCAYEACSFCDENKEKEQEFTTNVAPRELKHQWHIHIRPHDFEYESVGDEGRFVSTGTFPPKGKMYAACEIRCLMRVLRAQGASEDLTAHADGSFTLPGKYSLGR